MPPIGVPAGKRAVHSRRSNLEKEPWKSVPSLQGTVEREFVLPVHLGETLLPYRLLAPMEAVIPWDDKGLIESRDPRIDNYPGLADWWREAQRLFTKLAPATNVYTLTEKINYVRSLESQLPPGAKRHRVVYTKAGVKLAAAILENDSALAENGLYWAETNSIDEGRYLCAILNSTTLGKRVTPYQVRGLMGPRHFDKYIWRVPVPEFEPTNDLHLRAVALAEAAENIAVAVDIPSGVGFQKARSLVRSALVKSGDSAEIESVVDQILPEVGD